MSEQIKVLNGEEFWQQLQERNLEARHNYKAMYSSWISGIVKDPNLMMIPIDDHQVHRGDAVFEAMKVIHGNVYLIHEHLERLERSSKSIGIKNPYSREQMLKIINETFKASGLENGIVRLFLSRGPGSFSPNPYDTMGVQLYVVITTLQPLSEQKIKEGVSLKVSKIPVKESWFAQIKSCNYLQNVLMKKEAVDNHVDFMVGVTSDGFITEGSTENIIILTKENELVMPLRHNILLGTTMVRALELAKNIPTLKKISERSFDLQELKNAKEIMMVGTTLDIISVTKFEGEPVGSGRPGEISLELKKLLHQDQMKI